MPIRFPLAGVAFLGLFAVSLDARAEGAPSERVVSIPELPPLEAAPIGPRWYGWQLALADAGALGIGYANLYVGLSTFALGAPITHLAHGRVGAAVGSLAMRVVVPVAGAIWGYRNCPPQHPDYGLGSSGPAPCPMNATTMFFLAATMVSAIDATALSWERVERPRPSTSATWSAAPIIGKDRVGGAFAMAF